MGASILDDPTIMGSTSGEAVVVNWQFLVSRQAGGSTQIPSSMQDNEHKRGGRRNDGERNPQPSQPTYRAYSEEVLQEIIETKRFVAVQPA